MKRKILAVVTSVWVIFGLALVCRVGFALREQKQIPRQALKTVPFLYEPGNIAFSIVTGHGFASPFHTPTGPTAWEAPIYPLMIAGFFRVFGIYTIGAFAAAVVCNILFSSAVCVPIFFAARRVAGPAVGAGAAWLWAVFPNGVIIPFTWVWDTSLSALLGATILWATMELGARGRSAGLGGWEAYGLLWGFTLMVNPSFLLVMVCLFVWLIWGSLRERASRAKAHNQELGIKSELKLRPSSKPLLAGPVLAAGVAILSCVPWTVRNWVELKSFVPLRSNLGLELWLGNNEGFKDQWPGWLHPIDNTTERKRYAEVGEIAYMREKRSEAIEFIKTHPAWEVKWFFRRAITVWAGSGTWLRDFRDATRPLVRVALVTNVLATIGTIAGLLILFWRRNEWAVLVAVFVLVYPLPYYLTRPLLRYRHPVDSMVMLLCALAIAGLVRRLHAKENDAAAEVLLR